jgi:hypothetical protein
MVWRDWLTKLFCSITILAYEAAGSSFVVLKGEALTMTHLIMTIFDSLIIVLSFLTKDFLTTF